MLINSVKFDFFVLQLGLGTAEMKNKYKFLDFPLI